LRGVGNCAPAGIAGRVLLPGKICRNRQILPGAMGKYFHFSEKMRAKKPANPRKILVHADTGQR
jgi:hypothetical protein